MYFRPPCQCYALNCHFVYLTIPGTRPLLMRKLNLFVLYIYPSAQSEIHICSNKHETGLVFADITVITLLLHYYKAINILLFSILYNIKNVLYDVDLRFRKIA